MKLLASAIGHICRGAVKREVGMTGPCVRPLHVFRLSATLPSTQPVVTYRLGRSYPVLGIHLETATQEVDE